MIVGIFFVMLLLSLCSIIVPIVSPLIFLKPWDKDFRAAYQAFQNDPPRYEQLMRECIERATKDKAGAPDLMKMYRMLAARKYQMHEYREGDVVIKKAIDLGANAAPKSFEAEALSSACQDLGYNLYNRWRLDPVTWPNKGVSYQEKAVELVDGFYGPETVEAINKRCTLALMYYDDGQPNKARKVLDYCYELTRKDKSLESSAWYVYATESRIKALNRDFRGALEAFLAALENSGGRQLERDRSIMEFDMGLAEARLPDDYKEVDDWLKAKQFAKIDALSEKLLASKEMDSQGFWKYEYIPRRIDEIDSGRGKGRREKELKQKLDALKQWLAQNPNSPMARVCLAKCWIAHARLRWHGREWEDLSDADLEVIHGHLTEARSVLDADPKLASKTPCASAVYSEIFSLEEYGGDFDALMKIVDSCHKRWPSFRTIDFWMCRYIRLFGHHTGGAGSMRRFMEERAKAVGGAKGDALYAQMVLWMLTYFKYNIFEEYKPPLSWERTSAGLKEIIRELPDDYQPRAQFALLAALAKADDETIRSALK